MGAKMVPDSTPARNPFTAANLKQVAAVARKDAVRQAKADKKAAKISAQEQKRANRIAVQQARQAARLNRTKQNGIINSDSGGYLSPVPTSSNGAGTSGLPSDSGAAPVGYATTGSGYSDLSGAAVSDATDNTEKRKSLDAVTSETNRYLILAVAGVAALFIYSRMQKAA